jgi:hypothetical protein
MLICKLQNSHLKQKYKLNTLILATDIQGLPTNQLTENTYTYRQPVLCVDISKPLDVIECKPCLGYYHQHNEGDGDEEYRGPANKGIRRRNYIKYILLT